MKTPRRKYKMKKLLSLILCLLAFYTCSAAEPLFDIWGAYSYGNGVTIVPNGATRFHDPLPGQHPVVGTLDPATLSEEKTKSGMTLGIEYHLSSRVWVGASFTTGGKFSEAAGMPELSPYPFYIASYKNSSLYLTGRINWLKIKNLYLYSRAAIGIAFTSKVHVKWDSVEFNWEYFEEETILEGRKPCEKFVWQVSPVAAEYKPNRFIGIFAEGGFGKQGNLLAGVRVYFSPSDLL